MGHLLGAVTRACSITSAASSRTRSARATTSPAAWSNMQLFGNLFPAGHPYHHTTIGSMADLDAASLADVKQWFRDKYGPNNAVLVIAGDVNAAEAQAAGREIFRRHPARAGQPSGAGRVPTLAGAEDDRDEGPCRDDDQLQRYWAVPGVLDQQLAALDVGGSVLGGLASSRLDKILVRDEKLAVAVAPA